MANSKILTVRKLGSTKKVLSIVLVDGRDVWVSDGKKKIHPLPYAFHTCGNHPHEPDLFDQLSLAGVLDLDVDFRGPAFYCQPPKQHAGFYYMRYPGAQKNGRGNGEWEAVDAGGHYLGKKKRVRRKRKRARA